jgi:hypothetical protein
LFECFSFKHLHNQAFKHSFANILLFFYFGNFSTWNVQYFVLDSVIGYDEMVVSYYGVTISPVAAALWGRWHGLAALLLLRQGEPA